MKPTIPLSVVCVGLALVGCKSAKTTTPEDPGTSSNDDAAPAPDLAAPAPDLAVPAPDLATLAPDLATLAPDLAVPAPDLAVLVPDLAVAAPDLAVLAPDLATLAPDLNAADTLRDTLSSATDMATFCTGGASRMIANGASATPTVTGKVVPYDCCDGGEFDITGTAFDQPIIVTWQAQAKAFTGFSNIDLAKPPAGWTVSVVVGCTSTLGCTAQTDSYTAGLTGSLSVSIGKSAMYDMSLCLHVEESSGSPHPVLHALDLFATHIDAN